MLKWARLSVGKLVYKAGTYCCHCIRTDITNANVHQELLSCDTSSKRCKWFLTEGEKKRRFSVDDIARYMCWESTVILRVVLGGRFR